MTRMIRRTVLVGIAALAASAIALGLLAPAPVHAQNVNCSDFATQAAAQNWFEAHGGPAQDPAGLDAYHDGVALPVYVGRYDLGGLFEPRYIPIGSPARKPTRLKPPRPEEESVRGIRWRGWGDAEAIGTGTARVVTDDEGTRRYPGARVLLYRKRDGDCRGRPAQFYTRARFTWPAKARIKRETVKLVTGCGRT